MRVKFPMSTKVHVIGADTDVNEDRDRPMKAIKRSKVGSSTYEVVSRVGTDGQNEFVQQTTDAERNEEMHIEFLLAIFDVGLRVASPKLILEKMPTNGNIMTLDRIKSHLQKVRQHKNRSCRDFLKIYDRLLLDGAKAWIYGLKRVLGDGHGTPKQKDKQEKGPSSPSLSGFPSSQPSLNQSFSTESGYFAREPFGGLGSQYSGMELSSNLFKSASMSSDSLNLSMVQDPSKVLGDVPSPSAEWPTSSSNVIHIYTLHPGGLVAPSSQSKGCSSSKSITSDPLLKEFLPPVQLEVYEALHDLFSGPQASSTSSTASKSTSALI